jgi:rSAM/selenodomain-associated transferase 1
MTPMTKIAVFARAPVPGAAKTRLIPALGPEGAARLHADLMDHALAQAVRARLGPVELWCAPDCAHPFFTDCARKHGVTLCEQPPGDLGAKMLFAFEQAHGPLLLMGSDCPAITARDLADCAQALAEGADAVFLPAEDGGYGLVGAARPMSQIFSGIDWGGESVMAQTRDRLARFGLKWREARTVWDVDRPEDVDRLAREGLVSARLPKRIAEE